jgi:hypothetical protein
MHASRQAAAGVFLGAGGGGATGTGTGSGARSMPSGVMAGDPSVGPPEPRRADPTCGRRG